MESPVAYLHMVFVSLGQHACTLVTYHLEKGGMTIHDAPRVKYKKGTTTDSKMQIPSIVLRGDCWMLLPVLSRWHDYPSLMEGECHSILLVFL